MFQAHAFWLLRNPASACEGRVKTRSGSCHYFCIYVLFYGIECMCFFGAWTNKSI